MIIQEYNLPRIFGIFIIQPIVIFFFFLIATRLLNRNRNKLTLTLSTFYILSGIGFIVNIIFFLLTFTESLIISVIIYYISSFLVIYSTIFLVLFLIRIRKQEFSIKKELLILIFYGLGCLSLLLFPGSINLGPHTSWIPIYSWYFLLAFYIYFTILIFTPAIYFLFKLYLSFQDKSLRKKLVLFTLGILGMLMSTYGLVLYNTWHEPIFRAIWSLVSLIVIPSGFLIYYGIAHKL